MRAPLENWTLDIEVKLHNPCECCTTLTTKSICVGIRDDDGQTADMWEAEADDMRWLLMQVETLMWLGIEVPPKSHASYQRAVDDNQHTKDVEKNGPGVWFKTGDGAHSWIPKHKIGD